MVVDGSCVDGVAVDDSCVAVVLVVGVVVELLGLRPAWRLTLLPTIKIQLIKNIV